MRFQDGIEYGGTVEKVLDANHAFVQYDDGTSETVRFPDDDVRVMRVGSEAPAPTQLESVPEATPPVALLSDVPPQPADVLRNAGCGGTETLLKRAGAAQRDQDDVKRARIEARHAKMRLDKAVEGVLEGLDTVDKTELVVPTTATVAALPGNWRRLLATADAGDDPGVRILENVPRLDLNFMEMSLLVAEVLLRLAAKNGGHVALASFGGPHVVATRYDVNQYEKQKRNVIEVVLGGCASTRSGSAAVAFGDELKQLKAEGHSTATTFLDWCGASAKAKGRDQLKMSLQKGGAGMITGKHGDGDWGASSRDVTTLLYNQDATKYLAVFAGEVAVNTSTRKTRYPRFSKVGLLGTLAQRHGETYSGTRLAMGNEAVVVESTYSGLGAIYAFHQVLPGSPMTPMWNIVVDYK